jgi:hypothetical protein
MYGGTITIRTENVDIDHTKNIPLSGGKHISISVEDQGIQQTIYLNS